MKLIIDFLCLLAQEDSSYKTSALNPFNAKDVLRDLTQSNARRFNSSKGNPLALTGLKNYLP